MSKHVYMHNNYIHIIYTVIDISPLFQIQVPISGTSSAYTACTCFTIWRDHIWVGTSRGSITIMDTETGEKDNEIFFPGGQRKQIEIKHLALSSEDEVSLGLSDIVL